MSEKKNPAAQIKNEELKKVAGGQAADYSVITEIEITDYDEKLGNTAQEAKCPECGTSLGVARAASRLAGDRLASNLSEFVMICPNCKKAIALKG